MRYHVEMFDQMQFFFQEYNDHQLHCRIFFAGRLDRECLTKAVILTMDIVPILRSRYVERPGHPYWESIDAWNDDLVTFVASNCIEEEIDRFLTGKINERKGPQLMVRIVSGLDQDALCIVMNHMVSDGGGFKEYLYLLSSTYTNLRRDQDYRPDYSPGGSRSINQIYKHLRLIDRLKLLFISKHIARHDSGLVFPLSGDREAGPFISTHKLPRSRFQTLKEYSKKHRVTINDIVLAAYLRALHRTLNIQRGKVLAMPCAMDLRRFIPGGKAEAICNLTSTIICDIGADLGDSFEDTVIKVKNDMDVKKSNLSGLNGLVLLGMLFKLLPDVTAKKLFKKKFINPVIFITNIGIIDNNRLDFDNLTILDSFITGSVKYQPYFQLALTSFNESITFSINLYGSVNDRKQIENFFRILDEELPGHLAS